ncbi:MAG: efflux RND transporter periplasmic adaptor subunit [Anaerovibrio sp.]|uniref:efflux RND transporter periplasmic adaptor subunit n=1 Tax=Anaerovibrio sp. TaxID=1872532 RepID=UPI0025E38CB8|nr:efflux RND transporter periplasmic adaptor subunit [Anaerovibrio sp.]MCR5176954.1 efflux RND transporter periplasmic adaptor subunit [Anaerovibrio sp.]
MKKYFYIAVAVILSMATLLVVYGAWLNYSDENQIARRLSERTIQIVGAKVKKQELYPRIELDLVRFYSENMTDAVALTDGRIAKWFVNKNTSVHKGEALLSMVNEQIPLKIQRAASAVKKAEATLAQAYSAYQRQKQLMELDATSKEKYEASEAMYLAAQEELQASRAEYNQCLVQENWLNIYAPVAGEILIIYKQEGSYVQAGTPVALVGDFDTLYFNATLNDQDARHLHVGDVSTLRFMNQGNMWKAYDTGYAAGNQGWKQKINTVLMEITPPPEEPADIRRVVWKVDNRAHLLESMTYNNVLLEMGKGYSAITVPRSSFVDSDKKRVFVVDDEGVLSYRNVIIGADDGKNVEILSGLSEGEIVVSGDLTGLKEGMKVSVSLDEEGN